MNTLSSPSGHSTNVLLLFSILTGFATMLVACVFTRLSTGLNFSRRLKMNDPKPIGTLPYWIPWLGHALSFAKDDQDYFDMCRQSYNQEIFAVVLRGKKHIIVTSPSLVKQLHGQLGLSTSSRQYKLRHFFGDRSNRRTLPETMIWHDSETEGFHWGTGYMRMEAHFEKMVNALERTTYDLISFNSSWIDQNNWERAGKVFVDVDASTGAEVSFFPLIERFVGELTTTLLLGKNFLENDPEFLDDFRLWDSKGTSFMNRVPLFLPQMSAAAAARQRVLRSLRRFRSVLSTSAEGEDAGTGWSDLSDVSSFITDRPFQLKREDRKPSTLPDISVDAALIWGFNKPNTFIAWLLHRVYSDSALLAAVREEIKPYVRVEYVKSELPILEPPRVSIDRDELAKNSRLLLEILNETMRLRSNTLIYGVAARDLILTESQDDTARLGKSKPASYTLRKGELVCVPHRALQVVEGLEYPPGLFNPAEFNTLANLQAEIARVGATNRLGHAFGLHQHSYCPAKGFAECQILLFSATIISMWDIQCPKTWPSQKPGLCSMLPAEDVRVKISRTKHVE